MSVMNVGASYRLLKEEDGNNTTGESWMEDYSMVT